MLENEFPNVVELLNSAKKYGRTTLELFKLRSIDKGTDAIATAAAVVAILIFASLMVIMLNIGIALWLGYLLGKTFWGFFIVCGFYAMLTLLALIFRKRWIVKPLKNALITFFVKDLDNDQT